MIVIDDVETRVMVEQTTAVDPETRLGAFVGRVTDAELQEINRALMTVLELP